MEGENIIIRCTSGRARLRYRAMLSEPGSWVRAVRHKGDSRPVIAFGVRFDSLYGTV